MDHIDPVIINLDDSYSYNEEHIEERVEAMYKLKVKRRVRLFELK